MGYGRTNSGGSSNGLNFKVVQYDAEPTGTAAENTIAVVTDTAITSWVMSTEQPEGVEGMVWIEVVTESEVPFYADKKQQVKLYLKSVKQYVGGAWLNKEAYVYQDSAWVHFSFAGILLYSNGDECTAITGGWEEAYASGDYYNKKGTFTKNDTNITITADATRKVIFAKTVNKIDVSGMKTLTITASALTSEAHFGLHNGTNWNLLSGFAHYATIDSVGTVSLDISDITGEYYVACRAANDTATRSLSFTELKLSAQPKQYTNLYYYGDQYESVTGGWAPWVSGTLNTNIFIEEDGIRFYSTGSANIAAVNLIDLTEYTSIIAEVTDSNTKWFCLGATQDDSNYFNSGTWSGNWPTTTPRTILTDPGESFTIVLDVSACSGLWRVVLANRGYNSALSSTLRSVKLEKKAE